MNESSSPPQPPSLERAVRGAVVVLAPGAFRLISWTIGLERLLRWGARRLVSAEVVAERPELVRGGRPVVLCLDEVVLGLVHDEVVEAMGETGLLTVFAPALLRPGDGVYRAWVSIFPTFFVDPFYLHFPLSVRRLMLSFRRLHRSPPFFF